MHLTKIRDMQCGLPCSFNCLFMYPSKLYERFYFLIFSIKSSYVKALSNSNFVIVKRLLKVNWRYRWEHQKLWCSSVKSSHFATKGHQILVCIEDSWRKNSFLEAFNTRLQSNSKPLAKKSGDSLCIVLS